MAMVAVDDNGADISVKCTLSTANNSESDIDFTCWGSNYFTPLSSVAGLSQTNMREKVLTVASKTSYYMNFATSTASISNIFLRNDQSKLIIRAVCAYL